MDLRDWVMADLENLRMRITRSIVDVIPTERLHELVDGGGNPPPGS